MQQGCSAQPTGSSKACDDERPRRRIVVPIDVRLFHLLFCRLKPFRNRLGTTVYVIRPIIRAHPSTDLLT